MPPKSQTLTGVEILRQKSSVYHIEEIVLDFLNIWDYIHHEAKNYDLADALNFSKTILDSHIYPFFETHKNKGYLTLNKAWLKSYSSIAINFQKRGNILFPLNLITYEICYHQRNLITYFINRILTKEIQPTCEDLFEFLFPILTNFSVPLDTVDIAILKSYQGSLMDTSAIKQFKLIQSTAADDIGISLRTLQRRMNVIQLMQLVQSDFTLDMGRLGYETFLLIHQNPFPKEFMKYLLLSIDLTMATFSIVQLPYHETNVFISLQDQMKNTVFQPMLNRTQSWNLTNLSPGEDQWQIAPSFLHATPTVEIITPSPDISQSLEPTFNPFRPLTPADIKILDFLTIEGSFRNLKDLSKTINVSVPQISTRLDEYDKSSLLLKTHQFFNIGLDLSVFLFVSTETKDIHWPQHFLSFPKCDIFLQDRESPYYYFGYLKMPNKWIKPFARKVDKVKKEYSVKFYYKIFTPVDYFRFALSLNDTYVPNHDLR
ncbi:MAG: hypothetical protein EAX86_11130 [Candidatus Heimdallarchaeota archaeon]|nr:hypothetical protein [Candidatus Heimdallarchaeota archaeon]